MNVSVKNQVGTGWTYLGPLTLAKHKDVLKEVCRNHPVRDMKAQTFLASAADRFQVLNKNPHHTNSSCM